MLTQVRLGKRQRSIKLRYAHPRVVFPEPEGPHISVTWPFRMPPMLGFPSPSSEPESNSNLSSASRRVGRNRDVLTSRSSNAWAADTVGRRSSLCQRTVFGHGTGERSLTRRGEFKAGNILLVNGMIVHRTQWQQCGLPSIPSDGS